ncbi:MAG: N-6 DNA methylase [Anaerolineae bacterium]|nr:N-6 DNA methylase [Anaerolineae bacterium]
MSVETQLQAFVQYVQTHLRGDEKGEAQIFLDRLFVALGHPDGLKTLGGEAEKRIRFNLGDARFTTKFADLVIPGRVLIEMKKRGESLAHHVPQALAYWQQLIPNTQYMILCNFDEFWVYHMHYQTHAPMGKIRLDQLPENYGALRFLLSEPQPPIFNREFDLAELTASAASKLSEVMISLVEKRRAADHASALHFVLQSMIALFAEDIGLLPRYTFTQVIEDCQQDRANSHDLFTLLFTMMNIPGKKKAGRFYSVDYFNGGLFQTLYPIALSTEELRLLREAADHNWAKIRPEIFGVLFEKSMDPIERHDFGAHYTTEQDIRRIVNPVIVEPWSARINAASTPDELIALHRELCAYRVFDPACGSGNFLYIAYRALKLLEQQLLSKLQAMGGVAQAQRVSVYQFYGYDVNPFAVELAKVTLMIAKKLAADDLHTGESVLPLDNLDSNFRQVDALFEPWPEFDACIGNPPYLGAKRLKTERGVAYVNAVRAQIPDVPGNADYCVYWFRKAHALMRPGTRAGLVGTNTIRQNYSRIGGLDYITENDGVIYDAISSMPWSGDANVHVSIVNWVKGAQFVPASPQLRIFIGKDKTQLEDPIAWRALPMPTINSSLSEQIDVISAQTLACNTNPKRVFQGLTPGHAGFVLS